MQSGKKTMVATLMRMCRNDDAVLIKMNEACADVRMGGKSVIINNVAQLMK